MIEVIDSRTWTVHHGGIGSHDGGLGGQVTKCRIGGTVLYVRENILRDDFNMSSRERMGMKRGEVPKRSKNVLELLAPKGAFQAIAAIVGAADGLGRQVRTNRNFTWEWARRLFK